MRATGYRSPARYDRFALAVTAPRSRAFRAVVPRVERAGRVGLRAAGVLSVLTLAPVGAPA